MFNLVPINMNEVSQKLKWSKDNNIDASEGSVIKDAVLNIALNIVYDLMEGSYWNVKWNHNFIDITDNKGQIMGTLYPQDKSFIEEFKQNSQLLINRLRNQLKDIVISNN